MKIYTKSGDKGFTSLFGGNKVSKNHLRIESYGTIDELNSTIGCILAHDLPQQTVDQMITIQKTLFVIGAELATPTEKLYLANGKSRIGHMLEENELDLLEQWIDEMEESLPQLTSFILPGGSHASANGHLARTICRRAERIMVALNEFEEIRPLLIQYINRLSDYLFVAARFISQADGKPEVKWLPNA